ncbi:MAG: DUF4340 domain-containing protein [Rhodospirillales bacterium]|nr:DUF4340 domain-containing protein [Rhodospirillales bacterium]
MRPRNALILLLIGIVVLVGGWWLGPASQPGESRHFSAGRLMFPGLAKRLSQVARIEVTGGGKTLVLMHRPAPLHGWGVKERGLYPIQADRLHAMLTALAELRLMSPRTADPAQYDQLGVGDPNQAQSGAMLLRVLDATGHPLATLIVGHRRVRGGTDLPDQVFVRRPGAAQSWLAEGDLDVDADPQLWLDRSIMNIGHGDIAAIQVTRGGSTLGFVRKSGHLVLATIDGAAPGAAVPKLSPYRLDDLDRGLEILTFDDVSPDSAPGATASPGAPIGTARFTTNEGVSISVALFALPDGADPADPSVLARFSASGSGKAAATAARLNARLAGWTYRLGAWKTRVLVPQLKDLEPSKPSPAAPSAGATPQSAAHP